MDPLPPPNSSSTYYSNSGTPNGSHYNSASSTNGDGVKYHDSPSNRSPVRDRERRSEYTPDKTNNRLANTAPPGRVLGVFGLSPQTRREDLIKEFQRFGDVEKVSLIMDRKTQRSKCFAFVYFYEKDHAIKAKVECQNLELDGKMIRTDYSASERAHDPTPGKYHGESRFSPYSGRDRDRDRDYDRYDNRDRDRDRDRDSGRDRDRGYGSSRSYRDGDRDRERNRETGRDRDRGYSMSSSSYGNGSDDQYSSSRRYNNDKYSSSSSSSSSYRDDKYSSTSSSYRDDKSYDSGRRDYDDAPRSSSYSDSRLNDYSSSKKVEQKNELYFENQIFGIRYENDLNTLE
ncbi:RNA-binding region RNP-1 domain-containing protein [Heterostelium album PN500]|uniref:RNA-binding region RNP-1 domain-containing protein n=1 Tax=Heterostelium pallidum (strain ATCC 26659 / Pp 5 / PN500) TaxID=670386 RepID=D3B7Y6_HETP5|nr:RNA-binding region RNP-1 domain-containing protein [Heterostelium album PN500]EFA82154.1 RNA-binding region RNP-1 domain-containing protein [Heterostelium album PN500]|eukprot:XP_020434271.1 RNA-binding region RNP-1 domain-containing protein [Heterostelium album PN500]